MITFNIAPRRAEARRGGAALPLVHIRTGHAAGKVSIGFWDHGFRPATT